MTAQKQMLKQQQLQMQLVKHFESGMDKDEDMSRSTLVAFRAKEEEIERKKMEVSERVHAQLGRVEEATRRLADIRQMLMVLSQELEALNDPMRKEVALLRKRVDSVFRDLKPLGLSCQKKEKEYKQVTETFNEKKREKAQLLAKLMELVGESERQRMKKLEELSKNVEILN